MAPVLRTTQHDRYTAALARAHAQLWRCVKLADSLNRQADMLALADSAAAVHRAHERQIGAATPGLRTQSPREQARRELARVREAQAAQRQTGAQRPRPARDGGRPRLRAESA